MVSKKKTVRLAIDNNALCSVLGLVKKIDEIQEKFEIDVQKININLLYPHGQSKKQLEKLDSLLRKLKQAYRGELRFVITPTVLSEIFDTRIKFSKNGPNEFFHNFCVEHVAFTEKEQMLIDELTKDLLTPIVKTKVHDGHEYQKTEFPFVGNHNKNHDHDARIFSESIFAGTNIFTFDEDFKNKELIYETVQNFEKKHPETKGISSFRIITPCSCRKQTQKKQNYNYQDIGMDL